MVLVLLLVLGGWTGLPSNEARQSELLGTMIQQSLESLRSLPDNHPSRAETLCSVAVIQANLGDRRAAQLSFGKAIAAAESSKPVITAQINAAIAAGADVADDSWRLRQLDLIVRAQKRAGENEAAHATMGRLLKLSEAIKSETTRKLTLAAYVPTLAETGGVERAFQMIEGSKSSNSFMPSALVNLLDRFNGNTSTRDLIIKRSLIAAKAMPLGYDKLRVMRAIAASLAEMGRTEQALAVSVEIRTPGEEREQDQNLNDFKLMTIAQILSKVAKSEAMSGRKAKSEAMFEEAIRLCEPLGKGIEHDNVDLLRSIVFAEIVRDRVKAGDVPGASKTLALVIHPAYRMSALWTVAEARAKGGDLVGARAIFRESVELAGFSRSKVTAPEDDSLEMIALCQAKVGFIADAIRDAERLPAEQDRQRVWVMIVMGQAEFGDRLGAARLALKISDRRERQRALWLLGRSWGHVGDIAEAAKWVDGIKSLEEKGAAVRGYVVGYTMPPDQWPF